MGKSIESKLIEKLVMTLVLTLITVSVHTATVNIDYSQTRGNLPRYQKYTTTVRNTRGPVDTQLLKDIDMSVERTYYWPSLICKTEGDYNWNSNQYGFMGTDNILDNIISHGSQPLVTIADIPSWLTGETVWYGNEHPPKDYIKWEQLVRDILTHLKAKYPKIVYVSLMSEPTAEWTWYNVLYQHTANAVVAVNATLPPGVAPIKLGGNGQYSDYAIVPLFLDFVKDHGLKLDFIDYHIYTDDASYLGLTAKDPRISATVTRQIKSWLDERGMNAELIITEWCTSGRDYFVTGFTPGNLSLEASWNASGWSSLMQTGINVIPMQFANMDYAQTHESIMAPDRIKTDALNTTTLITTDGVVLPKYNVYKMLKMSKNYLVSASSTTNIYSIASKDNSGVALMLSNNQNVMQTASINLSNLPSSFGTGPIHYERYLVDNTHSNYGYNNNNFLLEKEEDNSSVPATNSYSKSFDMGPYATTLIVMTPTGGTPYVTEKIVPTVINNLAVTNNFATSSLGSSSIVLSWTAPNPNDDYSTTVSEYDIRCSSTLSISESNWKDAHCLGGPVPKAAGNNQTYTVQGLVPDTNYYFAIKSSDAAGNCSAISNITPVVKTAALTTNIALNKTVTVSSTYTDIYSNYSANRAVDGILTTRWASLGSDPQWISIDLGATYNITEIVLKWGTDWFCTYAKDYLIQVSNDGSNWQTIYTKTSGSGGIEDITLNGSGRYVRMYGTKRGENISYCLYSLWEFEIYGNSNASDPTPPAITITSPANNSTVTASLLTVSGTASDNVGLSKVELKVGAGGTYTAVNGTLSPWSNSVTLANGSNVIYAKATDTSNNIKETTITVTYTMPPDTTPPSAINTLTTGVATSNSVVLSWTSVGNDGNIGTASVYDIRYANVSINESNWATATQCSGEPVPLPSGTPQSYTVQNLSAGITYYFAMKVRDDMLTNWSGISNVVIKVTPLIKIMPLGDSITARSPSYRTTLWTLLNSDPVHPNYDFVGSATTVGDTCPDPNHEGHSGIRVLGIDTDIDTWLTWNPSDIILLHIGTNDVGSYTGELLADTTNRLSALIDKITTKVPNAKVYVASIIPMTSYDNAPYPPKTTTELFNEVITYNDAIPGVVASKQSQGKNVYFVDMYNESNIIPATDLIDGCHPSQSGSDKMANVWFNHLTEIPGPTITVTYPNGGESLTVGSQQTITWTSGGTVGNVNIAISTNSGTSWVTYITNTANDGSQPLNIPNTPSTTCRIRIQELDGSPTDMSDSNFTITSIPPTVSISTIVVTNGSNPPATLTIKVNASDTDGTISKVDFYSNGNPLLPAVTTPDSNSQYAYTWNNVSSGTYSITAKATDNSNATTTTSALVVVITNSSVSQQQAYPSGVAWSIGSGTTTIEAEDYDTVTSGTGEGIAYHDTTPGQEDHSNIFRTTEGVDIEVCSDTGAGYDIGHTIPGEWLEYSINVNQSGTYRIILRTARDTTVDDSVHIEFAQSDVKYLQTASVILPGTGNWQVWTDAVIATNVTLNAGNQIMRLVLDPSAAVYCSNFNYISLIKLNADTPNTVETPTISPGAGTYASSVTVTLGCATGGATIRYTTNGTDPTSSSLLYSAPFTLAQSATVRTRAFKTAMTDSSVNSVAYIVIPPVSLQQSYGNNGNPWQIGIATTTIEIENYDTVTSGSAEGKTYYDTTPGNLGGAYRTSEAVDIENCTDTGGGYNIGYAVSGEWLEYSVNVSETAEYKIIIRASNGQGSIGNPIHLEFGVHNAQANIITPPVSIPDTGGWSTWTDIEVSSNVLLISGNLIMKLVMDSGSKDWNGNFNYISIIRLTNDTTPPVVSAVAPANISGSGVVLTWTTNEPANSKIEYGLTTSYGSATLVADTGGVYSHSVTLNGLTENTVYHYRMVSVDMNGNTTTTGDYSFTTGATDPNPPVISNVRASVTINGAVLIWTTDENSDSQVGYGTTTAMGITTSLDTTPTRLHSVSIGGLQKGKTYYYRVYSRDPFGNLQTSAQYSFTTYNNNLKHRIYTYYYDDGTTTTKVGASASASLKFKLQVYNVDENSIATDYTGTLTLTTKNSKSSVLDTTDSTLTEADAGEKEVSVPFRSDIDTVELTGDTTSPIIINFNDMYIAKLVGYQGGSIRGVNGLKILIPTGILSMNKYLASIKTSAVPSVQNSIKYINTVHPICYDFGELTFKESAPELEDQVFTRAVNITIPYTTADIGTLNEDGLRIYYWTGTDWDLVTGLQTVDKTNNTVTATVKHFSTYRILGSYLSADMSNIKVYPNPYNPATAVLGKLKVMNLPVNSIMKLYNVSGGLVRELKEIDFGNLGWLEWDGKNADGDKVGRGIYVYQINDSAGNKKTGKIGLIK
ncbi:MAG: carbohydrate-binding protein [Elusimicrobia bacterium]|nr:carbohydrate-binding protein [Elusimicrobiota bacterium]